MTTQTATFSQINTAKTQKQMREIIKKAQGKIYAEQHKDGFEIRDLRPLGERLSNEFSGRGVKHYLGETHMIVTARLLSKFDNVVFA